MKLSDEYENDRETHTGLPIIYMAIAGVTFFVVMICIVLANNYQKPAKPQAAAVTEEVEEAAKEDTLEIGTSDLTSRDLDFWDMYKEDTQEDKSSKDKLTKSERYAENAKELLEEEEKKAKEEDLSEGGTKTEVTYPDGTTNWIMINSSLPKNNFDPTGFVLQDNIMRYYDNGQKNSFMGVDISDDNGTIDFEKVKKSGVDYCMVEVASRGYESGQINYDDKYYDNIQKATEAGLDVGVIFHSYAIDAQEAEEEAQVLIDNLGDFELNYPVVMHMEKMANDTTRIDALTKMQLTGIALAFCKKISEAGYKPMIMGDKYWLLRKVDLTLLQNYDIWLSQCADVPDYPYQFAMWQFSQKGTIEGIDGDVNLDICFIDYGKQ